MDQVKKTTMARKNLRQYMENFFSCTEYGDELLRQNKHTEWIKRINETKEFKDLNSLAHYLYGLSEEVVLPFVAEDFHY
ncbi:MAG: hypothetical protein HRT88_00145 [Lentisphaeraceae bacterium]|nr:hypothetical protein [Lentisphaeraceae bacterium]